MESKKNQWHGTESVKTIHTDSSKQRAHLCKKISSNKNKQSSLVDKYNQEKEGNEALQATVSEVMKGNFPWGNTTGTPMRIKKVIVEKHEVITRWDEEITLVKKEMANFVAFYMDVTIPRLERIVVELQDKILKAVQTYHATTTKHLCNPRWKKMR